MWNRRARIIWLVLDTEDGARFHLKYPIFCNVFRELLDSIYDLTVLLCLFSPEKQRCASPFSVHTINELTVQLMELIRSITENDPYDLINVSTDHVKLQLSVKNNHTRKVAAL